MNRFSLFAIRFSILLCALCLFVSVANAQSAVPVPEKSVPSADKPVAVPAEIQELLADHALLVQEIERIAGLSGAAVNIPVSQRELDARARAKSERFVAWLDAQKIPREWGKAGWRLERWTFFPPAVAPASPPAPEKPAEPSAPPAKSPEKKP